ncbi:unnamed protein product [Strongylus vulgaris]|uniref:NADH dehydrogenase [ubiquinone] 1 alpha subcomplex assembly factor 3 n=1 Tax=Strongylus vulgaris TaxID=40348 RepID=A0A3P7J7K9_STRVU|nr:unnamed protein product [Strongylus vulgaris]
MLPSWQQAESSSAPAATSGYTTPPANFRENVDEPESNELVDHDQSMSITRIRPLLRLLQSRRLASDGADSRRGDTGVLDGFHVTPLGDSDVPQRSRVSFLSTEMTEAKQVGVRGLSCYGFRLLDGTFLYGPVALFPKTALSWRVQTPADITPHITPRSLSLFAMLEPKIDILVVGAGDKKNIDKLV